MGLSFWGLRKWLTREETVIRNTLKELAAEASFAPSESPLIRLTYGDNLTSFFTSQVLVNLMGVPNDAGQIEGRDRLRDMARVARAGFQQLQVKFFDVQPIVAEDRQSAIVHLTVVAEINEDKNNAMVQELKLGLKKVDGKWLIHQIETVRLFER
jgi:hypothetical protein